MNIPPPTPMLINFSSSTAQKFPTHTIEPNSLWGRAATSSRDWTPAHWYLFRGLCCRRSCFCAQFWQHHHWFRLWQNTKTPLTPEPTFSDAGAYIAWRRATRQRLSEQNSKEHNNQITGANNNDNACVPYNNGAYDNTTKRRARKQRTRQLNHGSTCVVGGGGKGELKREWRVISKLHCACFAWPPTQQSTKMK